MFSLPLFRYLSINVLISPSVPTYVLNIGCLWSFDLKLRYNSPSFDLINPIRNKGEGADIHNK